MITHVKRLLKKKKEIIPLEVCTVKYHTSLNRTWSSSRIGFHVSGSHCAVYHYQFRVQFVNQMEQIQPSLTISLTGTREESGDVPITM